MKYLLVITIIVLGITSLSAQEKDKVRVGLDLGYVFAKDGGGILFNLEPKYNLTDNSSDTDLSTYSPKNINETLIIEKVDDFLEKIISWEVPALKNKVGF